MARAALRGRLTWQEARVRDLVDETPRTRSLVLDVPTWEGHLAGQHVDVRLTADDGYQAQRSYSIASGPGDPCVKLTVDRLDDGEVSPYLVEVLAPGDALELRGPIGRYFVWEEALGGPLVLIAGGSGVVPFRSMLRHHAAIGSTVPVRLLYSARSLPEVIFHDELVRLAARDTVDVRVSLTRQWPPDWSGDRGRIDLDYLREAVWPPSHTPLAYVCGPTTFVEVVADALVALGHDAGRIRTERFGATGARGATPPHSTEGA
jgi:ferredoxin-NADP reductase